MFTRVLHALGTAASRFSNGGLTIWEVLEGIECLQLSLNYSIQYLRSAMMRSHRHKENVRK